VIEFRQLKNKSIAMLNMGRTIQQQFLKEGAHNEVTFGNVQIHKISQFCAGFSAIWLAPACGEENQGEERGRDLVR
jgi:hypothetical protein